MQKVKENLKDIGILVRRALGFSHYGFEKTGGEMTSREREDLAWRSSALWFDNEQDFQVYAMTNYWPLGRCLIGHGVEIPKRYENGLHPI